MSSSLEGRIWVISAGQVWINEENSHSCSSWSTLIFTFLFLYLQSFSLIASMCSFFVVAFYTVELFIFIKNVMLLCFRKGGLWKADLMENNRITRQNCVNIGTDVAAFTSGGMNCIEKGHRRAERVVCTQPSWMKPGLTKLFLHFRVISGTFCSHKHQECSGGLRYLNNPCIELKVKAQWKCKFRVHVLLFLDWELKGDNRTDKDSLFCFVVFTIL